MEASKFNHILRCCQPPKNEIHGCDNKKMQFWSLMHHSFSFFPSKFSSDGYYKL
uniref:Uncharacterized protein n=1 Tax=Rhizophora mucronata TaxID=61149 RepID=A0A2P2K8H4_RHIMU